MKNKSISLLINVIALIAILASTSANADCGTRGCVGKITKLYVRANSGLLSIGTAGDEKNIDNCKADVYIDMALEQDGYESVYKILLSAMLADREVYIRTQDTQNNGGKCVVQYVTLSR